MIINFGSICADHVYQVAHLPQPGETLSALRFEKFLGGKGLNQSVAITRAGGECRHVGCVNVDDNWILQQIGRAGVALDHIRKVDAPTGVAVIYVDPTAENVIVISGAANQSLTMDMVEAALSGLNGPDNWVLFQNETNLTREIAAYAKGRGIKIAYSAAPFVAETALSLLPLTDMLVVNETEAAELASASGKSVAEIDVPILLVTLGAEGSELHMDGKVVQQKAFPVQAVDTTGAGDTFLGSFMAEYDSHGNVTAALRYASAASALQVTQAGASNAIPNRETVLSFLAGQEK